MVSELSAAQVLSIHIGRIKDQGLADAGMISMLKMSNLTRARTISALAREVMGGNGFCWTTG
jgi:glutaryl-CoA dehydrogenase